MDDYLKLTPFILFGLAAVTAMIHTGWAGATIKTRYDRLLIRLGLFLSAPIWYGMGKEQREQRIEAMRQHFAAMERARALELLAWRDAAGLGRCPTLLRGLSCNACEREMAIDQEKA